MELGKLIKLSDRVRHYLPENYVTCQWIKDTDRWSLVAWSKDCQNYVALNIDDFEIDRRIVKRIADRFKFAFERRKTNSKKLGEEIK